MTDKVAKDSGDNVEIDELDYIPGNPYSKLRRELSEKDLSNKAVQKLIISDIDKLESKVSELEIFQSDFYKADKQQAILEEKLKKANSYEILYSFCLASWSWLIWASSMIEDSLVFIIIGSLLIIGWIISKITIWK